MLVATIRGPAAQHQTCLGLDCLHYRHGDRARRVTIVSPRRTCNKHFIARGGPRSMPTCPSSLPATPTALRLAGVGDLDRPTGGRKLITNPCGAAHHLQTREGIRPEMTDQERQPVLVGRRPALVDYRAGGRNRTPPRPASCPVDTNELRLHEGTPLRRGTPGGCFQPRTTPSS